MKLSIITVNLNNLAGLKKTMQSVFEQTFTDYEYIIIDGGSTDGSKEYIEQYSDRLSYWVSEKDGGIYQGMNKGIRKAAGEYILFLNSGDFLYNEMVLGKVFLNIKKEDLVYGNLIQGIEHSIEAKYPEKIYFEFMLFATLPHAASFIRRDLFDLVGFYYESYKIVSDWLFYLLALFRHNCTYKYIDCPISVFDTNGISRDVKYESLHKKEREDVIRRYFFSEIALYNEVILYRTKYEKIVNRFPINKLLRLKILLSKAFRLD